MLFFFCMEAIVLLRRDTREADQILTFAARGGGAVTAMARGVKKGASKLSSHLEPLAVVEIALAAGREMPQIIGAERREIFSHLAVSLPHRVAALAAGGMAARLVTERDADPRPFLLLRELFCALDRADTEAGDALLWFFLHLLSAVGMAPVLDACARCRSANVERFSGASGGVVCAECARMLGEGDDSVPCSAQGLLVLQELATAATPVDIRPCADSSAIKKAVPGMVDCFLRYHAGVPLPWGYLPNTAITM